jgi:hypothetical protein
MPRILLLFSLAFFAASAFAQNTPFHYEKWGEISEADLKMTVYPNDSTAAAVVLQDIGTIDVPNGLFDMLSVVFNHLRRIKILDLAAFDQASLSIPYSSSDGTPHPINLEVQVFQPTGETQTVKPENIFDESLGGNRRMKKLFIPDLQKGSVIEYRYTLRSTRLESLESWYFQGELPVRWSQIQVTVPEMFDYIYLLHIPRPFDLAETHSDSGAIMLYKVSNYGMANMPAIRKEPYLTTLNDYWAHIGFQIKSLKPKSGAPINVINTWTDIAKQLEESPDFGERYLKSKYTKQLWKGLAKSINDGDKPEVVMEKVLRYVSKNVKWDAYPSLYAYTDLDELLTKKTGDAAELNLTLVALLRKAGLDARPMLVSTRQHGITFPDYPFIRQFNSVVVIVRTGAHKTILDATNQFHPVGELTESHYNSNGWVVDVANPQWVDIRAPEKNITWLGHLRLLETGTVSGQFNLAASGPEATTWRSELDKIAPKEFLKKHFGLRYPEMTTDSTVVTDLDSLRRPLSIRFSCRIPDAAQIAGAFIYFRPVVDFLFDENPFKSLKRSFPVSFTFPLKAQYVVNLDIPAGYNIEELPEPVRISLPNDGGKLFFSCTKASERQVQLVLKLSLSQLEFLPDQYDGLRHFFELVAAKAQSPLVLKKV